MIWLMAGVFRFARVGRLLGKGFGFVYWQGDGRVVQGQGYGGGGWRSCRVALRVRLEADQYLTELTIRDELGL